MPVNAIYPLILFQVQAFAFLKMLPHACYYLNECFSDVYAQHTHFITLCECVDNVHTNVCSLEHIIFIQSIMMHDGHHCHHIF